MYKNGFVAAIKINDKFVEEQGDGTCVVPFDSEYAIRLKNRNSRKALAKVYIDGEDVSPNSKFILDVNSTLDLERFVKDLDKGDKFKFVPLSDGRVADKNNFENGCIEVHFQLVAPVVKPIVIDHITEHHHHHHDDWDRYPWYPYKPWRHPYWHDGPYYVSNAGDAIGGGTFTACNTNSDVTLNCNNEPVSLNYCSSKGMSAGLPVEKGATIKGSESRQKFSYSYVGELEQTETIIKLQLVGTRELHIVKEFTKTHCAKCGKKYVINDVYCSGCGEKK